MNRKVLLNDKWKFHKTATDVEWENRESWEQEMEPVDLPHDWLIYNTQDLYENSIGWYRREFVLEEVFEDMEPEEAAALTTGGNGRVWLRFEGVYMDSVVYVNGKAVKEWKYGYSTFDVDITDALHPGSNEVVVKVTHIAPNSRWYSGAGIYRNVWMLTLPEVHIPMDGIYVSTKEVENGYELLVDTEISWGETVGKILGGGSKEDIREGMEVENGQNEYFLEYTLYQDEEVVFVEKKSLSCGQEKDCSSFLVDNPKRWDITEPNLYHLEVKLLQEAKTCNQCVQKEKIAVGFRTIAYLPDKGFLLNGRKVRLNGVCDHHDLGALGAAFSKAAMRRKLCMMRSMGVNAIRTSHNMPAVELMEMADEMGFLIVSEAFDMWEISKNTYDYGRFFKEWAGVDVRSWIRRDRNHPSVIMWSIGNEIPDTHADAHGQEITVRLMDYVKQWDYRGNAPVTIGSNYMPWENAQKCADIVKMAGYNYAEKYYAQHHEKYPDWIIYGSETSSVVQSRGIYHFPLERATLIEEDEQCSSLGNSTTSWAAKNAEYCITMDRDAEYSCGQFIWTAFDYIGEPTPYQTKNSYFGQIDTAGFPKDSFYLYQAEWTDYHTAPMVHVYPYWDFNPGQLVDIRICSNAPEVELFVNGKSQGRRQIDHKHGTALQPHFKAVYEPGSIKAVAYDEKGNVIAEEERHSFGDTAEFVLKADKDVIKADGQDMIFVEISAVDKTGYPVENASDYVKVTVSGAARLVGLDNGDSTDYDQYKGTVRKLFQGKLLAMIAAKTEPGEILVKVEPVAGQCGNKAECYNGNGQPGEVSLLLQAVEAPIEKGISAHTENFYQPLAEVEYGFVPVRKIELTALEGQSLSKECSSVTLKATIYPPNATDTDVIWKVTDAAGLESKIAKVEALSDDKSIRIHGLGDGELFVRCMSKNGTSKIKLISQMEMKIEGLGAAFINPYEEIAGVAYSSSRGHIGKGISSSAGTDKDGETWLTYSNLDFGDYGSDELTLFIFAHDDDPHMLQIWQGIPEEEGSDLLGDVLYHKKHIWEVFQPETYRLNRRVSGVQSITIVTHEKMFLEKMNFTKQEKAFAKLFVAETAVIYGDSYERKPDVVEKIGNNVSLSYENMNFGTEGAKKITICGRTPLPQNTIQLRITGETELVQVLEFPCSEKYVEMTFELPQITGETSVTFVFLPGCNFDFKWFEFR